MPIKNAIHSQQVYGPMDEPIMAEQELCMERLYDYNHKNRKSCNKPVICCVIWIKGFIERSRR